MRSAAVQHQACCIPNYVGKPNLSSVRVATLSLTLSSSGGTNRIGANLSPSERDTFQS